MWMHWTSKCMPVCICSECVSLHVLLYVSAGAGPPVGDQTVSLVCLHGVWCLCSNDQQVCSIVSACRTLYCRWGKQPYTATCIHAEFSVTLLDLTPRPHPLLKCLNTAPIVDVIVANYSFVLWHWIDWVDQLNQDEISYFFPPLSGLWLRFHFVIGGYDRHRTTKHV